MNRFSLFAFGGLVTATVAAFFITQHLKVTTPLIAGFPRPDPQVINPRSGGVCYDPASGRNVNNRVMSISFYLLHHSDSVDVWIADPFGRRVATLATDRFMPGGSHPVREQFTWDGRDSSGAFAPDGRYYVKVRLIHQARTVTISDNSGTLPVTVKTMAPKPVITEVSPSVISASHLASVKIDYMGNENRGGTILISRLRLHRRPLLVKSFLTLWKGQSATWDGKIRGRPAPVGAYLIQLSVSDAACNTGVSSASALSNQVVVHG